MNCYIHVLLLNDGVADSFHNSPIQGDDTFSQYAVGLLYMYIIFRICYIDRTR